MKRLLSIFIVLVMLTGAKLSAPPAPVHAQMLQAIVGAQASVTYAHIQTCGNQNASEPVTSVACTFGSNIGASHLLYVCSWNISAPLTGVIFTGETGTFTPEITNVSGAGPLYESCWHVLSTVGGGSTITLSTVSGVGYPGISIDEWSCTPGPCTFDKSDAGNGLSSGLSVTQVSLSITPSSGNELIIGSSGQCCNSGQSMNATTGSGFTVSAQSAFPTANEWQIQTAAAPITAAFTSTQTPTSGSVTHVAAFK